MMLRILGINTIFVIIYIIRRARSPNRLHQSTVFQVQALLLLANFLILFQRDIQRVLDRFI